MFPFLFESWILYLIIVKSNLRKLYQHFEVIRKKMNSVPRWGFKPSIPKTTWFCFISYTMKLYNGKFVKSKETDRVWVFDPTHLNQTKPND